MMMPTSTTANHELIPERRNTQEASKDQDPASQARC